jgi:ABC-type Mn2+/Zn2+ transport system ATPase subunit
MNPPSATLLIPWGTETGCVHGHALQVSGLSVDYGNIAALRQVTFEARCGQSLALMGRNGAGKSTLLKALAGLVPSFSSGGGIVWRGQPVEKNRREIAYLPQREEVDWNFPITVRGLVEMGRYAHLGAWRRFGARDTEVVDRAIEAMELAGLRDRPIRCLSGGQQQRAFIARALAQEAHVLLLDEPFAGLDREAAGLLQRLFRQLTAEGRLLLASHHDLGTVQETFSHALLLNVGPVAYGTAAEVLTDQNVRLAFAA